LASSAFIPPYWFRQRCQVEGPEDREDEFAARRRGVHALGEGAKADALLGEILNQRYQVLERPAQAVQPPHDHRVAGSELVQEPVELGSPVKRPRSLVGEDLHAPSGLQRIELERCILIGRRYPCVPEEVSHGVCNRVRNPEIPWATL